MNNNKIFHEILNELKEMNRKQDENSQTLKQIADNLMNYQQVVDFIVEDTTRKNQMLMQELNAQFTKLVTLLDPQLSGLYRQNLKILSDVDGPVYSNSRSYLQYIASATRFGVSTTNRALYRMGYRSNISTSVFQNLDEGFGSDPGSPGQILRVFSTSASDSATGTGIQRITIAGINSSGLRANEQVTLAGTTRVMTTTAFQRIDFFAAIAVGTYGGGALGTISLTNASETITFAQISIGETQWRGAKLNVDSTQIGFIHQWSVGSFKNSIRFELVASPQTDPAVVIPRASTSCSNTGVNILFPLPIIVQQNGRIFVRAIANGTVNEGTTQFTAHVEDLP